MTSLARFPYIEVERAFAARILMLDLFYIALALLFFVLCWFFTKACDRL